MRGRAPGTAEAIHSWIERNLLPNQQEELKALIDAHATSVAADATAAFISILKSTDEGLRRKAAPMPKGERRHALLGASFVVADLAAKLQAEQGQ